MATWWELTIPAVATLAGGLAGVWWQSRSGLRMMVKQAEIAQMTRKEDEQLRRYMQLFDLRREAYVRMLDVTAQAVERSAWARTCSMVLENKAANTEADQATFAATFAEELETALEQVAIARGNLRPARESIELLAPRDVINAALALGRESIAVSSAISDGRDEYYQLARARFIHKARQDLGLPADESSESIEKRWREAPSLLQRMRERDSRRAGTDPPLVIGRELRDRLRADAEQESEGSTD
jgi:hypothetical protein